MFLVLLVVNFVVSLAVCFLVIKIFGDPITKILRRLIPEDIYTAWYKYIIFAIFVIGVSGGARIWELERYITPPSQGGAALELNLNRWVLEIYRTIISTLQSEAWILLIFFVFALITYVVVKIFELRRQSRS